MFYLSDKKPLGTRIVLVQSLLRYKGIDVQITGKWDQQTAGAVAKYRTQLDLEPQGPVNGNVFFNLIQNTKLKVVESVDARAGDVARIAKTQMNLVGVYPLMNPRKVGEGVKNAIDLIIRRAKDHKIALLRFFAHGNEGVWISVALGDPFHTRKNGHMKEYEAMKADFYSYIDYSHFERHHQVLSRLRPHFASFGSVELNTCKIGNQEELLIKLANVWGVPVTGGYDNQRVGNYDYDAKTIYRNEYGEMVDSTFEMEGKVFTAYPNNSQLADWAAKIDKSLINLPRLISDFKNMMPGMNNGK